MKKYWIITFGCQMNKSDSERIAAKLEKKKYVPASKIDEADLIVVNMCSVRQSAVDRVYGLIPQLTKLKTKNYKPKTVLTGCIIKYDFKKFKDKFNYILPKKDLSYSKIRPKYKSQFSVYIPVVIGCNNFCSYCVVPYTRGPEISRPAKEILEEIKYLVKENYKEIWLVGENVNSYKSNKKNFSQLLKQIDKIPGKFWIRFISCHPKDFSQELIKTIKQGKKITPYISLPVQSGDNQILKKMNRPYTVKKYKELVKKIRKNIPDVNLSTDVIVGFPGETKKQFQNTVKLFREIEFDIAYISQYSPRPGTAAFKLKDTVSLKEKQRRDKALTEVLKKTALKNNKKYIGKIVEVLPEYERKSWIIGKTREYKTIKFQSRESSLIGEFVKVKVINAIPWGLKGELIK